MGFPEIGLSIGVSAREEVSRFVELSRQAERLGIDCLWVIDSHLAMKDVYAAMSVGLWETDRISFGTGVTNFQTRDITVTASTIATLASMAPGRVFAGVGAGDSAVFPLGRRPSSTADLRQGIFVLRSLLAGEPVSVADRQLTLPFRPRPTPPVYLSASQPRMLALAGEVADGVIVMGAADPELIQHQVETVRQAAVAAQRRADSVAVDVWVTVSVDEDRQRALDDVRSWASAKARWMAGWKHLPPSLERFRPEMRAAAEAYDFSSHLSVGADHASIVDDELTAALAVAGDADYCIERLTGIMAVGCDRLTITLLSRNREQRLEVLVSQVLPELRSRAAV